MRRLLILAVLVLPASASGGAPAPSIAASALAGPAPLTVRFTAQAPVVDPGPAVASYSWDFGDGATATGPAVAHRFTKPGRYVVSLIVTDALGGTTTTQAVVRAQALGLAVTPPLVVFGKRTVLHGALVPGERGAQIVLERRAGSSWQPVQRVTTDALGRFHFSLLPGQSGDWRARRGELRSPGASLTVAPQVHVETRPGTAFLGAPIVVNARPRPDAGVHVTVFQNGREVAQATGAVGRQFTVPTPGTGGSTRASRSAAARSPCRSEPARARFRSARPARTCSRSGRGFAAARPRSGAFDDVRLRALRQGDRLPERARPRAHRHRRRCHLARAFARRRPATALPRRRHPHRGLQEPPDPDGRPGRRDALVPAGLLRRRRDHAGRQLPDPLEGARDDDLARPGDPLPDDDLPHELRHSRFPVGADLSGEPRLRADPDLDRRLAVPAVAESASASTSTSSRPARVLLGGSSSASRRCTTDRESTPTSRPCSSTGARSTSASSSSR